MHQRTLDRVLIFGAGLVPLIAAYRYPSTPQTRAQLRWIVWAFELLLLSVVVSVAVPLIVFGQYPFLSVGIVTAVWCMFPLSIAFGVLRYRLFDVDAVLRATFVYGVLTTVLVYRKIFHMMGMSQFAPVVDSEGEAVDALGAGDKP